MRLISTLFALCLCICFIGCETKVENTLRSTTDVSSGDTAEPAGAAAHPARVAANKVLAAIIDTDTAAIKSLLNKTNQKKIGDDDIAAMLEESKKVVGDNREITELRKGRSENEVLGKVLVADGEVLVVVLTLEDNEYRFEDLNSPDVDSYEAMEMIKE